MPKLFAITFRTEKNALNLQKLRLGLTHLHNSPRMRMKTAMSKRPQSLPQVAYTKSSATNGTRKNVPNKNATETCNISLNIPHGSAKWHVGAHTTLCNGDNPMSVKRKPDNTAKWPVLPSQHTCHGRGRFPPNDMPGNERPRSVRTPTCIHKNVTVTNQFEMQRDVWQIAECVCRCLLNGVRVHTPHCAMATVHGNASSRAVDVGAFHPMMQGAMNLFALLVFAYCKMRPVSPSHGFYRPGCGH